MAASKLKSLVNKLGTLERTPKVTWTRESSINTRELAYATGQIGEEQICLSLGDFSKDERFEELGTPVMAIEYNGFTNFDTTITVACDSTPEELNSTLEAYGYVGSTDARWEDSNFDATDCCEDEGERCCVVAVTKF